MISPALRYARANSGIKFRPDADTVLWLPGQDDAYSTTIRDRSGKNNNGTITGAVWTRLGTGLWCLSLDGSDDKVECGTDTSVTTLTKVTAMAWVFLDAIDVYHGIISNGPDAASWANHGFTLRITTSNKVSMVLNDSGGAAEATGDTTLSISTWYFVALAYDLVNNKVYLNGVEDKSNVYSTALVVGTQLRMGEYRNGNNMKGRIALPRVVNAGYTGAQVNNIYNQERGLFGV